MFFLEKTKSDEQELKRKEEMRRAQRGEVDFVDVENGRGQTREGEGDEVRGRETVEADDEEEQGDLGRVGMRMGW